MGENSGFLFLLIVFIVFAVWANSYLSDEPVTHSCNINGENFPFEFDTCEQVCNAVGGRFYPSVLMAPNFVYGCEIEKFEGAP